MIAALVTPISAQEPKVEVTGLIGWTFSDGVSGDAVRAGDGNFYDRIDPKDSVSFGFGVGVNVTDNAEVGFLYGNQPSKLLLGGTNERELGDFTVSTYHGYFAYNYGAPSAKVRPFIFGGLGATDFGSVDVVVAGVNRSLGGETQFSTTWGGGVKVFPSPHIGFRGALKFTPTYIKTDPGGTWCDPYWGCYVVGNAQYSNQWEFSGGITARF
jgi:hypothetical protein